MVSFWLGVSGPVLLEKLLKNELVDPGVSPKTVWQLVVQKGRAASLSGCSGPSDPIGQPSKLWCLEPGNEHQLSQLRAGAIPVLLGEHPGRVVLGTTYL